MTAACTHDHSTLEATASYCDACGAPTAGGYGQTTTTVPVLESSAVISVRVDYRQVPPVLTLQPSSGYALQGTAPGEYEVIRLEA